MTMDRAKALQTKYFCGNCDDRCHPTGEFPNGTRCCDNPNPVKYFASLTATDAVDVEKFRDAVLAATRSFERREYKNLKDMQKALIDHILYYLQVLERPVFLHKELTEMWRKSEPITAEELTILLQKFTQFKHEPDAVSCARTISSLIREREINARNLLQHGMGGGVAEIETFTGHSHTLREDIDFLYSKLLQPNLGLLIAQPHHIAALLYNLKMAVDFCEQHGVKTFAADKPQEAGE